MDQQVKRPIKNISNKTIQFLIGLMMCLVCFVLIMDVGYVARTLNYVFFFLFGYGCYFIYFIGLLYGIYLIFNKRFSIKNKIVLIISIVFALIGVLSIFSLSITSYDLKFDNLNTNFLSIFSDYYSNCHMPYLFSNTHNNLGGGFIGFLFGATFSLSNDIVLSYFISALFLFLGILIFFAPYIISLIRKQHAKSKIKKANLEQQFIYQASLNNQILNQKPTKEESNNKSKSISKNYSKDIIRQASMLYHPNDKVETNQDDIFKDDLNKTEKQTNNESLFFNNTNYQKIGGLSKAHYFNNEDVNFKSSETKSETFNENNILNKNDAIKKENENIEQMTFDFAIDNEVDKQKEINDKETSNFDSINIKQNQQQIVNDTDFKSVIKENNISNQTIVKPKVDALERKTDKFSHNVVFEEKVSDGIKKDIHTISFEKFDYELPSLDLLKEYDNSNASILNNQAAIENMAKINETFDMFKVGARATEYIIGPSITQFAIKYDTGVSFKSVQGLVNDISIRLGGVAARFEPIVQGKPYSGFEVPNAKMCTVGFKEVLEQLPDAHKNPLSVAFGKNIQGKIVYADINDFPHMLVGGTTGSGKSIFIHSVVMTLIMRNNPAMLRLVLVDPKRVEMKLYENMPHLLCPIITEPEQVAVCLSKLVDEMESRYSVFSEYKVTNIKQYNELCASENKTLMPYIVVVLDEYSDLVERAKDISRYVISLSQKSRACGIHIIIATQRPSTNIVTGVIKGNLPTHVALMTSSSVDSITIIGEGGAEKLLGKGDMLVQSPLISRTGCVRLQSAFVQNSEIASVVNYLKSKHKTFYDSDYLDLVDHSNDVADNPFLDFANTEPGMAKESGVDPQYENVKKAAMAEEYFSISKITRIFGFGFTRAGKLFNKLQQDGIVATNKDAKSNSKGCKVLIHDDSFVDDLENNSNELTSLETIDEYNKNSDESNGAY